MVDHIANFLRENAENVAALEKALLEKATTDEAFREELKSDPKGVARRQLTSMFPEVAANPAHLDEILPEALDFKVVERTGNQFYLVLPPLDTGTEELSMDDLEMVAGGGGDGGFCSERQPTVAPW